MRRVGLLPVILLLCGLCSPAAAQMPLEWKLAKGDEFYLRIHSTVKQTLKTAGREVKNEAEQTIVLGFKIKEKSADQVVLEQSLEGVSVKVGTAAPVQDSRIAGTVFTVTLSVPKLEILKFEGHDKFLERLAGEDAQVRKTLQALVSEETLRRSVRESLAFLPDRPVKDGETWERVLDAPFGALGNLRLTTAYKLEGKEDVGGKKVDKITFGTTVDFKVGKADPAVPYHVVSGDIKTDESRGIIHFDSGTGRLVQSKSRLVLRGRMILSASGTNVDTEVQQEQTTEVVLLKDNPLKK